MSSKPHHTATDEKSSDPHASGLETSATNYCPHCGAPLDRSLAQHMAQGMCYEHTSRSQEAARKNHTDESKAYPDPPMLENHDSRDHIEPDTDERRALADELADAGVWP